jgi:cytochrome c oxidase subunit 3
MSVLRRKNPYQVLAPSALPFIMSLSLGFFAFSTVLYLNRLSPFFYVGLSLTLVVACTLWWFITLAKESYRGEHTIKERENFRIAMILFLVSEAMFFFSFFWAHFHLALSPSIWIGKVWPPSDIDFLDPYQLPLLNTLILLTSSKCINHVHLCMSNEDETNKVESANFFLITIFLAILFTLFQLYEWLTLPFFISDSAFGSDFYMLTGLHGIHVILGTSALIFCYILNAMDINFYSSRYHLSLTLSIWYWHFVDIVWLFLYISVYLWGGF